MIPVDGPIPNPPPLIHDGDPNKIIKELVARINRYGLAGYYHERAPHNWYENLFQGFWAGANRNLLSNVSEVYEKALKQELHPLFPVDVNNFVYMGKFRFHSNTRWNYCEGHGGRIDMVTRGDITPWDGSHQPDIGMHHLHEHHVWVRKNPTYAVYPRLYGPIFPTECTSQASLSFIKTNPFPPSTLEGLPLNTFQTHVLAWMRQMESPDAGHVFQRNGRWFRVSPSYFGDEFPPLDPNYHRGGCIVGVPGSGKTLASLARVRDHPVPSVVICPVILKSHWEAECRKWGIDIAVLTWYKAPDPSNFMHYKRFFVDEAHDMPPKWRNALRKMPPDVPIYFLTGTPLPIFNTLFKFFGDSRTAVALYRSITSSPDAGIEAETVFETVTIPHSPATQDFIRVTTEIISAGSYAPFTSDTGLYFKLLETICHRNNIDDIEHQVELARHYLRRGGVIAKLAYGDIKSRRPTDFETEQLRDECAICLSEKDEPVILLRCGHSACYACIQHIKSKKCHICRGDIAEITRPVYNDEPAAAPAAREAPRRVVNFSDSKVRVYRDNLVEWLRIREPNQKLIVYVTDLEVFDQIRAATAACDPRHVAMWTAEQVASDLPRFSDDPNVIIAILSTEFNAGLNLPVASHMWLMDAHIKSHITAQCMGRNRRFSGIHRTLYYRAFVYEGGFDHFLWSKRSFIGSSLTTRRFLMLWCAYTDNSLSRALKIASNLQQLPDDVEYENGHFVIGDFCYGRNVGAIIDISRFMPDIV